MTAETDRVPHTSSGQTYWSMAYWFATGWWFAQDRTEWVPDRSHEFADWVRLRRDEYEAGVTTSLGSIPDLWKEFNE